MIQELKKKVLDLWRNRVYKKAISSPKLEHRFTNIFKERIWYKNGESHSGDGSTLKSTEMLRVELQSMIDKQGSGTIVDIGCGDFNWMRKMDFGKFKYHGIDIVKDLIDYNNEKYANENIKFDQVNAVEEAIPDGDIVICKDVLFHLSFSDGLKLIKNITKSNSKTLIITSNSEVMDNVDIYSGRFRNINLQLSPYNFPKPTYFMEDDNLIDGRVLGVWDIANIRVQES